MDRGANYSMLKPVNPEMVGVQVFACTDDGSILSWNGNELREKGEKGYRLTHQSVLAKKSPEGSRATSPFPPNRQDKNTQRASLSSEISRRPSLELSPGEMAELLLVNARLTDSFFKIAIVIPTDITDQSATGGRRRRKGFVGSLTDGIVEKIEPNRQWKVLCN